jgi:hypothetical protein
MGSRKKLVGAIDEGDVETVLDEDVGDSVAHRPRADDCDVHGHDVR